MTMSPVLKLALPPPQVPPPPVVLLPQYCQEVPAVPPGYINPAPPDIPASNWVGANAADVNRYISMVAFAGLPPSNPLVEAHDVVGANGVVQLE
jgi:hypothetical protein